MFFPRLKCPKEKVYSVKSFGSLRMGPNVPDGCFSEMENLTGDKFPLMSVRKKRALYCEDERWTAEIASYAEMQNKEADLKYAAAHADQ